MYSVKEIFHTLQGEGRHFGRASVFCRFTGCNLWNGKDSDRSKSLCSICDTDFIGTDGLNGGKFRKAEQLADKIQEVWTQGVSTEHTDKNKYVIFTGGEPLLQLDKSLVDELHKLGFEIGVETNGTIKAPSGIDWLCVSPKTKDIIQTSGDELKLLFPYPGLEPVLFEKLDFKNFSLQPLENEFSKKNTEATVSYCMKHPHWKLSLQMHKVLGIS